MSLFFGYINIPKLSLHPNQASTNHKSRQQSPISTYDITLASSVGGARRNQEADISSSFEQSTEIFSHLSVHVVAARIGGLFLFTSRTG